MKTNYLNSLAIFACVLFTLTANSQTTLTYSGGSWSPYAPSASTGSDNVIVDDKNATITNGAIINDLTLNSGGSLNQNNQSVTVNGDLLINFGGSLRIYGAGSVNVTGTSSINITGNSSSSNYNIWTSPFGDGQLSLISSFPGVNPCDLYTYNASTQGWRYDYSDGYSTTCNSNPVTFTAPHLLTDGTSDGNFDIGRGYFVPGNASNTRIFSSSSQFNNGDVNVPLYGSSVAVAGGNDWNLIGNPYPSVIKASNFIGSNSLFNAVYLYVGSLGAYQTLSSASAYKIAPGQGFMVDCATTTDGFIGNAEFRNSHRLNSNYLFLKSDSSNQESRTYLSLHGATYNDQIQIIMDTECLDIYDNKFDARKLRNINGLNFASMVQTDPNLPLEQFVFNGIKSLEQGESKIVPLFVEVNAPGTFSISLDSNVNVSTDIEFILEDSEKGILTNLLNSDYSFVANSADTFDTRFFLKLTNTQGINNIQKVIPFGISVLTYSEFILFKVENSNTFLSNIQLINSAGSVVLDRNIPDNSEFRLDKGNLTSGLYIVRLKDKKNNLLHKRIIIQ